MRVCTLFFYFYFVCSLVFKFQHKACGIGLSGDGRGTVNPSDSSDITAANRLNVAKAVWGDRREDHNPLTLPCIGNFRSEANEANIK